MALSETQKSGLYLGRNDQLKSRHWAIVCFLFVFGVSSAQPTIHLVQDKIVGSIPYSGPFKITGPLNYRGYDNNIVILEIMDGAQTLYRSCWWKDSDAKTSFEFDVDAQIRFGKSYDLRFHFFSTVTPEA